MYSFRFILIVVSVPCMMMDLGVFIHKAASVRGTGERLDFLRRRPFNSFSLYSWGMRLSLQIPTATLITIITATSPAVLTVAAGAAPDSALLRVLRPE